jgi:hypothetical protein
MIVIPAIETAIQTAIKTALPTFRVESNIMATAPLQYELITNKVVLFAFTGVRHIRTANRINVKSVRTSHLLTVTLFQSIFQDRSDIYENSIVLADTINGLELPNGSVCFLNGDANITGYINGATNAGYIQYLAEIDKLAN